MNPENAILLSGFLKAYRKSLPEFVKTVVKPGNADVFCVFKRNSSWKCRSTGEPDEHDEEALLKEQLGSNLKSLIWIDTVTETQDYICKGEKYLNELWIPKYGKEICEKLEHWMSLRNTVDQYQRLRLASREMINYAHNNGKSYKRVLRARVDILPTNGPKPWYNLPVNYRDIFINPNDPYEFRDLLFVTDMITMNYICENFPENYPRYMPTTAVLPHKTILAPECQLLQFMIKEIRPAFWYAPFSPTVEKVGDIEVINWNNSWDNVNHNELYLLEL